MFEDYGVLEYIEEFYDVLHTFGQQYILADIEEFIESRRIIMKERPIYETV